MKRKEVLDEGQFIDGIEYRYRLSGVKCKPNTYNYL